MLAGSTVHKDCVYSRGGLRVFAELPWHNSLALGCACMQSLAAAHQEDYNKLCKAAV